VEPASHEEFAPFGQLISEQDAAPAFHGDGLRSWQLANDVDGTTELMFIRYEYKPMIFSTIERHFNETQCFIPLAGAAMVMVVAPRTDETDRSVLPGPESLRAFLVEGSSGVLLWKGVWHALNRFPVQPPGAGFALLTATETQSELERQSANSSAGEGTAGHRRHSAIVRRSLPIRFFRRAAPTDLHCPRPGC